MFNNEKKVPDNQAISILGTDVKTHPEGGVGGWGFCQEKLGETPWQHQETSYLLLSTPCCRLLGCKAHKLQKRGKVCVINLLPITLNLQLLLVLKGGDSAGYHLKWETHGREHL